jgi:hypothetical protein
MADWNLFGKGISDLQLRARQLRNVGKGNVQQTMTPPSTLLRTSSEPPTILAR